MDDRHLYVLKFSDFFFSRFSLSLRKPAFRISFNIVSFLNATADDRLVLFLRKRLLLSIGLNVSLSFSFWEDLFLLFLIKGREVFFESYTVSPDLTPPSLKEMGLLGSFSTTFLYNFNNPTLFFSP